MKKTQEPNEITYELINLVENLSGQIIQLRKQIAQMSFAFNHKAGTHAVKDNLFHVRQNIKPSQSKIIMFPQKKVPVNSGIGQNSRSRQFSAPILAVPGRVLHPDVPDCRPVLQRDGLILLAWDKRYTEAGERFTAYWVTSTDAARFYASRLFSYDDLKSARPDHKSYAAEDGIEFYGQSPPDYIVHVAPELMKSNPNHKELRTTHINILKRLGSKVNFNYKYLLKTEKNRKDLLKNDIILDQNQAG